MTFLTVDGGKMRLLILFTSGDLHPSVHTDSDRLRALSSWLASWGQAEADRDRINVCRLLGRD